MYILFDHYKKSEPDFWDRRHHHRPHVKAFLAVPPDTKFPKGGNGKELAALVRGYISPGDVAANMQLYTGDDVPGGYKFYGPPAGSPALTN